MGPPEAAGGASPSDKPDEALADEGLLRKFEHREILEKLDEPEERRILVEMMRAFEGPEESEEEDGRGLYHDALALLRYCRARKWSFQAAHDMLRSTGRWRRSFDFAGLVSGEYFASIVQENDSGKLYVRGCDRRGRPALYMRPRNENSTDNQAMVRHLAYCVERAVRCIDRQVQQGRLDFELTDPDAGKFVLCVDFADYGLSNLIPLSVARAVISILQDHYPERLGQAFIVDAPWILNAFIAAVTPFVDPVTLEKVQFVTEVGEERTRRLSKAFDPSVLEPEFGGTATAPFESYIFMNCRLDGTEFGLEFNEQLAMSEEEVAAAKLEGQREGGAGGGLGGRALAELVAPLSFWRVSGDGRVMLLSRGRRGLVRELARALASERDGTVEELDGLFDDAGALIRYLQARDWAPARAEAAIRATARWRKALGLAAQRSGMFAEAIARESAVGKMYVRGFDRRGRPILYVKLDRRDSRRHEDSVRYFVYCIERAIACIGRHHGVPLMAACEAEGEGSFPQAREEFVLLVDFAGYSCSHRPKMKTVREAMIILKDHYPELLGDAYLLSPPLKVCALWKLLRRMVDPALYNRVTLVRGADRRAELLRTVFDPSTPERAVGGEAQAPFDSSVFLHRQVGGEVYGTEFEAQASASGLGGQATTGGARWVDGPSMGEEEEGHGRRTLSLENICGGSNAPLW